jgi:hypothetical protein
MSALLFTTFQGAINQATQRSRGSFAILGALAGW